jgi:hypothetical protein
MRRKLVDMRIERQILDETIGDMKARMEREERRVGKQRELTVEGEVEMVGEGEIL